VDTKYVEYFLNS